MQDPGYAPDRSDYTGLRGDRWDAWGQDRSLMHNGHWTGFGRSLLEEDVVIQTSMGPILDRTKEHLSSSDVAVAQLRRMLLELGRRFASAGAIAQVEDVFWLTEMELVQFAGELDAGGTRLASRERGVEERKARIRAEC